MTESPPITVEFERLEASRRITAENLPAEPVLAAQRASQHVLLGGERLPQPDGTRDHWRAVCAAFLETLVSTEEGQRYIGSRGVTSYLDALIAECDEAREQLQRASRARDDLAAELRIVRIALGTAMADRNRLHDRLERMTRIARERGASRDWARAEREHGEARAEVERLRKQPESQAVTVTIAVGGRNAQVTL